jgi:predicted extracellular nuclease
MQQPGLTSWGGIWVNGGTLISGLSIGDQVNITGVVEESFGLTRISNITNSAVVASGQPVPAPLELDPALFTTYSATGASQNEQYEGMLVKLKNPVAGQNLFVVDSNADAATNRNNGEYRIGADVNDPNTGCRVLAGRQNSNTFSSLNVRYVNSPRWFTQDGQMNVPAEIVLPGSEVTFIQGVMTYSFGNMKLLPRNDLDITLILSTRELTGNNQFGLFPNPAKENLHIKIEASSTSNVEIFNAKGQKVLSTTVNGKENTIAIDKLVNGLYQVRVSEPSKKLIGVRNLLIQK